MRFIFVNIPSTGTFSTLPLSYLQQDETLALANMNTESCNIFHNKPQAKAVRISYPYQTKLYFMILFRHKRSRY